MGESWWYLQKELRAPWLQRSALLTVALGILLNELYLSCFYSYLHWTFSFWEKKNKVQYCSSNVAIKGSLNQEKWKRGYRRRRRRITSHSWFRNKFLWLGSLCEIVTKISACHWNLGDTFSTLKFSKSKGWVELPTTVCWNMRLAGRDIWGEKLEMNC